MALGKILLLAIPIAIAALMTERDKDGKKPPAPAPPPGPPPSGVDEPAKEPPPPGDSIMDALPEQHGPKREDMILAAVAAGRLDPVAWRFVTSHGPTGSALEGFALQVPVMADAFKFEGVRFAMDYRTGQYIADDLELQVMTPYMDALTYEQADVKPGYTAPQPASSTKSAMLLTSSLVDKKVAAEAARLGIIDPNPFAANIGKNWVLTRKFWLAGEHPVTHVPHAIAAANHGLYRSAWDPVQNVGVAHGLDHVDGTQNLRLMAAQSWLTYPDGVQEYRPTAELLTDEQLAPLLTGLLGVLRGKQLGEGALPAARHPAIPGKGVIV